MLKKAIIFLAVIIVAGSVFFLLLRRHPATLLQNARRTELVEPWVTGSCNYFWLSRQDILLLEQGSPYPSHEPTIKAFHISAASGERRELNSFERILNNNKIRDHVKSWQVSPDGRWLLAEKRPNENEAAWYAVALDGSQVIKRPYQEDEEDEREDSPYDKNRLIHAVWKPNSQGWVQAVQNEADNKVHVYLYDLAKPAVIEHKEDFMLYDRSVIGFYNPQRLLAVNRYTGDGGAIGFADFSASPTATPRSLYFQYVPANMNAREAVLSPQQNRIAWICEVKFLPFGLNALRNSNFVHHEKPILVGLWISKLDCSDLHEIGTLDARDDDLHDLRWTPDGCHLSFVSQNAVYTVPVN